MVRLEWLGQLKTTMVSSGIERGTFRLVGWCLNQLRYRVHHFPSILLFIRDIISKKIENINYRSQWNLCIGDELFVCTESCDVLEETWCSIYASWWAGPLWTRVEPKGKSADSSQYKHWTADCFEICRAESERRRHFCFTLRRHQ
jgi:hypothetical protein